MACCVFNVVVVELISSTSSCPVWAQAAVELLRSISWSDGVKDELNQALVSLGLLLLILVVFVNCCLGFHVVTWL